MRLRRKKVLQLLWWIRAASCFGLLPEIRGCRQYLSTRVPLWRPGRINLQFIWESQILFDRFYVGFCSSLSLFYKEHSGKTG